MHVVLHKLAEFVRAHGLENEELHEGAPCAADILLIGRIDIVSEDLTLVQVLPPVLILAKVLHERVKESITVRVCAQLIPDGIWKPGLAWVGHTERIF